MQPIGTGMQPYPAYANCFDRLTTNGILADDVVGYITGTPSPYLQNYVAQRGWSPTMPGQIMPDALPTAPLPAPMTVPGGANPPAYSMPQQSGSIYKDIPTNINENTLKPNSKYDKAKKIAAGVLISALAAFGIYKGVSLFKNGAAGFKTAMSKVSGSVKQTFRKYKILTKRFVNKNLAKLTNFCKTSCQKIGNFFQNLWNKVFHKTP